MPDTTFHTDDNYSSSVLEEGKDETKLDSLEEQITLAACKMLEDGARGRQKRFEDIRKNEDMYFGVNSPALKGHSNIPFDSVVMRGFIDSLQSGIKEDVDIEYGHTREQDKMNADKISAVWRRESSPSKADWNSKFMDSKLMASLAGVSFLKSYVAGTPKFETDLTVCDHYDMVTEPMGGSNLDKHLYKFQMNIFRTKEELNSSATNGFYNLGQVRKLIIKYQNPELVKKVTDLYGNKQIRYTTFGIDMATMGYVGQNLYRLVEGVVNFNGKWYYLVFSYETKTWIRVQPLEEVFEHAKIYPGRGPWVTWHTHRHPFLFWTQAPADDVRPIGYTMKKIVNLTVDNLEKRNWDMTAYDPKVFTDPTQLLYKQDGLVRATLKPGQQIGNGIFKFQTPDTTSVTINMVEWLNNFLGQKTGITPDSQGASNENRVGILMSNLQQVSKRLMLTNSLFHKAVVDLGVMFDFGCFEHLREPYAVKLLGPKGAKWEEEVTSKDLEAEFVVTVNSGNEDAQKDLLAAQKRQAGFTGIESNPLLLAKVNINWHLRQKYKDMGYDEEQISFALDVNNDGDQETRAEAAQAIADCLDGKPLYRIYRNATPAFIRKIMDFCDENYDLIPSQELAKLSKGQQKEYAKDMQEYDKLMAYANAHVPIAQKNMERRAVTFLAAQATAPTAPTTPAAPARPTNPIAPPMQ